MTKEEFIDQYASESRIPKERLLKYVIALPCDCAADECEGWAMVANNEASIKIHNELYLPKE